MILFFGESEIDVGSAELMEKHLAQLPPDIGGSRVELMVTARFVGFTTAAAGRCASFWIEDARVLREVA